ncbi:MAG: hypothetical protein R2712_21525 [Vicinamibacterales bacterium]
MPASGCLPFTATLADFDGEAATLMAALDAAEPAARWRCRWLHPRFREGGVDQVAAAALDLDDARLVVAREYGFSDWPHLADFTEAVVRDADVLQFERAADAVVGGDVAALQGMLRGAPELARARSTRRHHAALLHYVAANGVEDVRQRTPPTAVEVARVLLDAGADVDAFADAYGGRCTTLGLLVSSRPPADAGLQTSIAELLVERGASLDGRGSAWASALGTALAFGYADTARMLVRHGAPVETLAIAAGLGRVDDVARLLPTAAGDARRAALALAAQHGHVEVVAPCSTRAGSPTPSILRATTSTPRRCTRPWRRATSTS